MQRKPRLTISLALSTSVLCCTILTTSNVFAQDPREKAQRPTAMLSPEEVTVDVLDWNAFQADALSRSAAVYESSWAHGSSAHFEPLVTNMKPDQLRSYGFGSSLYAAVSQNAQVGWVHFAVPTPVVDPQLKPATLHAVLLALNAKAGYIAKIDVWDGSTFLLSKAVSYTGSHLTGSALIRINFTTPPAINSAIGISTLVKAGSTEIATVNVLFAAAGAEYIR